MNNRRDNQLSIDNVTTRSLIHGNEIQHTIVNTASNDNTEKRVRWLGWANKSVTKILYLATLTNVDQFTAQ